MIIQKLLILLLILTLGGLAVATAEDSEITVYEEEEVVVTATRIKQQKSKAPGKTEVITKESMEASGASRLTEALASEVVTYNTGGVSGETAVQLGGVSPNQTLVLINGIPANTGTGGYFDLSYFPVAGIERVEVVHGPLSALYGANALGGVVNIITDLTGTASNRVNLKSGSNAYAQLDFTMQQPQFGLAGGALTTDGHRKHSATTNSYLLGQYDFWQTEQRQLRLNLLYNTKNFEDPLSVTNDGVKENLSLDLAGKNLVNQFEIEYKLYTQRNNYECRSDKTDLLKSKISGSDLAAGYQMGPHYLLGGIQLQQAKLSRNEKAELWHNGALFLQDQWQIAPQWEVVSGVRWDTGSVFSSPLCPRLSLNYTVTDEFTVKLGYGKAFRAPTFDDLYYPESSYIDEDGIVRYFRGNPELKPETSKRYDVTGEWQNGSQTISLNYFMSRIVDEITWRDATRENGYLSIPVNIAKMQINGVNLSWSKKWNHSLRTGLKYLWTDRKAWDPATKSYSVNENTYGKNRYTLNLGYQHSAWDLNLNWNYITDRNNGQADYGVLDLYLSYRVNAKLSYGLAINNLSDREYQIVAGYPMPAREYYLSAKYLF